MGQQLTVIEERVRPWHCGTQHADWEASNCDRCTKRIDDNADATQFRCEVQKAIFDSMWGDGTLSPEIARRAGYDGQPTTYNWQCAEVEWTEEWKAECRRRRTWNYRIRRFIWRANRAVRKWIGEKIRKYRERWRMPIARRHLTAGTSGCWADWCTWAMSMNEKPDAGDTARRCRADAAINSSCWCGKFRCETPTRR